MNLLKSISALFILALAMTANAGTYYLGGYADVGSPLAWTTANGTTASWSDGSAGDTSTYTYTVSSGPGYSAFYDNGAAASIKTCQFTGCWVGNSSPSESYLLEGSNDTTTWTSISSGTVSGGNQLTGTPSTFVTTSLSSLTGSYRYYRLTSSFSTISGSPGVALSDWRLTFASSNHNALLLPGCG